MKSFVKKHIWILSIFVIALLIRGLFLYIFHEASYADGIAQNDRTIAHFLVQGKGFSSNGVFPQYHELPGYPLFLAIFFFVFGEETGLFIARLAQIFLSALGVFLVFDIGRRLINRSVAYIAALLWALWAPEAFVSTVKFHDAPLGILILAGVYFFIRAVNEKKVVPFAFSGLMIGISGMVRSDFILLPIAFLISLLLWRSSIRYSCAAVCGIFLCIVSVMLPWGIRNLIQFDKFTLVRDVTWQGMWEGFGEFQNPVGAVLDDGITFKQVQEEFPAVEYGTVAYQEILRQKSLTAIRENPLWYSTMLAKRFGKMLAIGGTLASSHVFSSSYVTYGIKRLRFFPIMYHLVFFAAAIFGTFIMKNKRESLIIFGGIFLYGIFIHLPIYWEPRYLIPTETMLIFPAAAGLVWFFKKFLSPKFVGS